MQLDIALNKALEEIQGISPYVIAAKSNAIFDGSKFTLPFFNRTFFVHHPEVVIEEMDKQDSPPQWLQLILLHYLLKADGVSVADQWTIYKYLPGGYLFEARFYQMAIRSLLNRFGNDLEGFCQAALSLGGTPMSRTGDAAFRFLALPQIPLACILYLGDDEVAPSINIFFDAAASHYLLTEDLSYVGAYLSAELRRRKPS